MAYILLEYLTYMVLVAAVGAFLFMVAATVMIGREGARLVTVAARRFANHTSQRIAKQIAASTRLLAYLLQMVR